MGMLTRLPAVDGLRAIAVLSVVAYHAGLPIPAGFVGVDVFFVISGYLITRLLHEEVRETGRIDFVTFYARRSRRILPAAMLVILATLAMFAVMHPASTREIATSSAAASVFVANVYFQLTTGGYWDQSAESIPLLHLWSLSVEEQFYLLWPLLMLRVRTWRGLAVFAAASFCVSEMMLVIDPHAAFYQMPSRAWELALGGLVAMRPVRLPRGAGMVGLSVVMASTFQPMSHFPGFGALPAVIGSALLIAAIHNGQRVTALEARPVVYIGLISYSLYLWHWPLLALDATLNLGSSALPVRVAICMVAFVLAALTYRYVETPFRRSKKSSRHALAIGVVTLSLFACSTYAIGKIPVNERQWDLVARDWPETRASCHQSNIGPPSEFASSCQTRRGKPDVVIWGDSMALAWQPFAALQGKNVAEYSRDACPPFDVADRIHGAKWCRQFNRMALAKVKSAKVVYLAANWRSHDIAPLEETLADLDGKEVVIIGPTPRLPANVPDCMRTVNMTACEITREQFELETAMTKADLTEMAAKYGATYIDPTPYFCTAKSCGAYRGDTVLYWDNRHISSSAARGFAEFSRQ